MKIPKIIQLPSGMYFCQLRLDGQSISITDADPDVVAAKAYAYKAGVLKARRQPEDITLKAACDKYIAYKRDVKRLSPTTIEGYEKIVSNSYPKLMKKKLSVITPGVFKKATSEECTRISERTGKPLAAKTIENSYSFIKAVLEEYVPGETFEAETPEVKHIPPTILTPEEILPVIKGTNIELPCLLSMWLSLSMSELRGLTKSKSIHNGKLTITETVVDVHGKPIRKDGAKEEKRTRTLDIPTYIQGLIDQVEGDVIITDTAQAISKRFYRLLEKAGLPHMAFHKLRHVNASVMVELQIPDKEAQDRGGWQTNYIFKQVYAHAFGRQRTDADKKMNAYFETTIGAIANENANNDGTGA